MAAAATVVAAFAGLIWAISTGFFDVSRRELEVRRQELQAETRELEARRDRQSAEYRRQTQIQNNEIQALHARESELRQELDHLGKPLILEGQVERAPWLSPPASVARLHLTGVGFGTIAGAARVSIAVACSQSLDAAAGWENVGAFSGSVQQGEALSARIVAWYPTEIRMDLPASFVKSNVAGNFPLHIGSDPIAWCGGFAHVLVQRHDGEVSNRKSIVLRDIRHWATR